MPTKEQIEFDLRMGVAGMPRYRRYLTRYRVYGPLTPYETPESRARRLKRRHEARKRNRKRHPETRRRAKARQYKAHAAQIRARVAQYKKTPKGRAQAIQSKRNYRSRLSNGYVSQLFRRGTTLTSADVPPEIIVSVRSLLHAKRKLHQLRNPVAVQHPNAG